jgi:hypothetical protein
MNAIFSSRSADTKLFLMWATKTLSTAHLGTRKNKQLLAATLADNEVYCEANVKNKYPLLPEPVFLTDKEAFKGANGQELEIRVVGKRNPDNCFFNVADVGKVVGLKRLEDAITDNTSAHKEGVHYRIFYILDNSLLNQERKKKKIPEKRYPTTSHISA